MGMVGAAFVIGFWSLCFTFDMALANEAVWEDVTSGVLVPQPKEQLPSLLFIMLVYTAGIPGIPFTTARPTLGDTQHADMPEFKFSSDKTRYGKPLEAALTMTKLLGLAEPEDVEKLRALGEQAIIDEVTARASDPLQEKDEFGWTDLDWLCYITHMAKHLM